MDERYKKIQAQVLEHPVEKLRFENDAVNL